MQNTKPVRRPSHFQDLRKRSSVSVCNDIRLSLARITPFDSVKAGNRFGGPSDDLGRVRVGCDPQPQQDSLAPGTGRIADGGRMSILVGGPTLC